MNKTMTDHERGLEAAEKAYYRHGYPDENMEAALKAYLDASGFVLVPKEPTEEMLRAGRHDYEDLFPSCEIYENMIAAAPSHFGKEGGE